MLEEPPNTDTVQAAKIRYKQNLQKFVKMFDKIGIIENSKITEFGI